MSSVVGYIGCFSVVQSAQESTAALSWLCLEIALSLLRMYIWSLNPTWDDAPPLEFVLKLDNEPPLPTCNMYSDHIDEDQVLPLTRANQFLNSVTSFAGLIDHFEHPDLTLYYSLTRRQVLVTDSEPRPCEWVLYIAVFDHKERTTRVYTRGGTANDFYSIESSIPVIDLEHGVLETKLGKKIGGKNDPILAASDTRYLLETHYQSIMGPYSSNNPAEAHTHRKDRMGSRWTMIRTDTMSAAHQESGTWTGLSGGAMSTVTHIHQATLHGTSERDHQYLELGRVERMLAALYTRRWKWVEYYMELVIRETGERSGRHQMVRRVGEGTPAVTEKRDGKQKAASGGQVWTSELNAKMVDMDREHEITEELLMDERYLMEALFVYEVERWEAQLWKRTKKFIGSCNAPEKKGEWRANCWKRLDVNIRAMDARMDSAKAKANEIFSREWQRTHNIIRSLWQSVVERFVDRETPSLSPSMPVDPLHQEFPLGGYGPHYWWMLDAAQQKRLTRLQEEIASRLARELEDVKDRLNLGLERCNEFWADSTLVECRHSRSKHLTLHFSTHTQTPFDVYYRDLKRNKSFMYIHYHVDSDEGYQWLADVIRDMPWITTVFVADRARLPDIQRDTPLFINSGIQDIDIAAFVDNDPLLACSQGTFIFFRFLPIIAVSFVGPTSGNLILKFIHSRTRTRSAYLTVKGTSFQLTIPPSPTVDYITLYARPSESGPLLFERGTRNNLIFQVTGGTYDLYDIQLLDEAENLYDPASPSQGDVSAEAARCVSFSIVIHCSRLCIVIYCRHSSDASDVEASSHSSPTFSVQG